MAKNWCILFGIIMHLHIVNEACCHTGEVHTTQLSSIIEQRQDMHCNTTTLISTTNVSKDSCLGIPVGRVKFVDRTVKTLLSC